MKKKITYGKGAEKLTCLAASALKSPIVVIFNWIFRCAARIFFAKPMWSLWWFWRSYEEQVYFFFMGKYNWTKLVLNPHAAAALFSGIRVCEELRNRNDGWFALPCSLWNIHHW